MSALSRKVAIVTGVASPLGIGFAIAGRLARSGVAVLITDLDGEAANARAAELRSAGHDVQAQRHDVSSEADWQAIWERARELWGGVDYLVNNAGVLRMAAVDTIENSDWDLTLSTNLTSCYLGIKLAARHLSTRGGGAIVNVCSVSGILGTPNCGAYTASKGGLRAYTKCAALDLAPAGIRVNSVHPGFVATEMQSGAAEGLGEEAYAAALATVPLKRFGTAADVANAVAFLLSDDAAYVTGTELVIDGGLSCGI